MTPTLRIHLLGEFRLWVDGQPLDALNQPRQQALLAYLLLHRHAPQPRQQIAFRFWPDSSERQAFSNLRKLLYDVRKAWPWAGEFICADHLSVGWRKGESSTCDVEDLQHTLAELEQSTAPDVAMVERVLGLYRGELLPTCYEDWILPLRRALHDRLVSTLGKAVGQLEAQREGDAALRCAESLLELEPLDEANYRAAMRLRVLKGDRAGALRLYNRCAQLLELELGAPPAAETQALYERVLAPDAVLSPARSPLPQSTVQIPLVGRQREWEELEKTWREITQGPRMVALWGDAGVGKTRLVEELMQWARLRPGTVAYARTYAYAAEGSLAYAPFVEWLRSGAYEAVLADADKIWLTELTRLLPELQRARPDLPAPLPMREGWQRRRFHEALARVVLAAPAPVLLVLDDLQWCDGETLAWLHFLLRQDGRAQLLVVGTARAGTLDEHHPIHELRQQLLRNAQWMDLELAPLSASETAALAGYLTETDVSPWARRLYQETEGNPLFVVEMVRAGYLETPSASQGESFGVEGAMLPPTVQSVIAARLAQLTPAARQVAEVAATIGRTFTFEIVAAASDMDEDELIQALDELWRRRILREQGQGHDFSHDKVREVAYAAIAPMRRRRIHESIAQALERVYAEDPAAVWDQLASHYEKARLPAQALPYLVKMARKAESLDAFREASAQYARALALCERQLPADRGSYFDVLSERSALLENQGETEQLGDDIQLMLALARSIHDVDRLAKAHVRQAHFLGAQGNLAGAIEAGEQALSIYEAQDDKAGAARALRQLGLVCWSAQDYGNALRYSRKALQLHRQLSDVVGEATALHNLAEIYRGLQSPRQAIRLYEQALDLYSAGRDHRGHAITLYGLAYTWRQVVQPDQALRYFRQAQAYCEQENERHILSRVHHATAILLWEMQQPDAAIDAMDQALDIARAIGHLHNVAYSLLAQAYMVAQQSRVASLDRTSTAQGLLQEALIAFKQMGDEQGVREVQIRLDLLARGVLDLPEPPATMNWIRAHIVLAEGKVYCEYELPKRV